MTGEEIQAQYFSPLNFGLYLGIILAILIAYYQWAWTKKCNNFVRVLVVKSDGTTSTEYAPKTGGYVALKSHDGATTRLWPINKLSAIEMLYPGDGFIPTFLQKKIKAVIVDEDDWEPLLNRGSYSELVASPDVVKTLRALADRYPDAGDELGNLASKLSTAPTREMVASPAVLGGIMKEKVSEMVIAVSKDSMEKLDIITGKLDKVPNATAMYIGIGLAVLLGIVMLVMTVPSMDKVDKMDKRLETVDQSITTQYDTIKRALGVQ